MPESFASLLGRDRIVPVVVIEDLATAVPVATALYEGGVHVLELTLRTPCALEALEAIATAVPQMLLGAGTIVSPDQAKQAHDAGARFLVSPGATPRLLDAMASTGLPFLPGASTVSEILALREAGYTEVKFFPAEASGGRDFLNSVRGPLPDVRFCPTGGITPATARAYLALPNVLCIGGSWLTPADAVSYADWPHITHLARTSSGV